ncbi:Hypothetical protein, putative [Bodo saltans]|uniref:Uncharacterized protein n=1 Tax=Bodo saltans TaxID=75058 RepID=A0A0S4JVT5_BODSA|nr:Hypothetical protein, putative [Bodo saltans]|eukprot:CUG94338.1 Hypothetical protein, putative [Bodo saltans]
MSATPPSSLQSMVTVNMNLKTFKTLLPHQLEAFSKLLHGSRRPSVHPEFLTLEILRPGFASGNLAALLTNDEESAMQRDLFRSEHAFGQMQALLRSGNYRIDFPEHAAMLVVAWLLEQERDLEAMKLVSILSPWMNEVKFVPTIIAAHPHQSTTNTISVRRTAAVGDVGLMRSRLAASEQRGVAHAAFYEDFNRVNTALMHLQALAVHILLDTLGEGSIPCQGTSVRNEIPADCAMPFQKANHQDASFYASLVVDVIHDMTLLLRCPASVRHSRRGSATRVLLRALHKIAAQCRRVVATTIVTAGFAKHVQQIMASVLTRRGCRDGIASDAYRCHMMNVQHSLLTDQRHVTSQIIAKRVSEFHSLATLTVSELEAALAPLSISEVSQWNKQQTCNAVDKEISPCFDNILTTRTLQQLAAPPLALDEFTVLPRIKRTHRRAVAMALESTFEELQAYGSIASAEVAGIVLHQCIARHRGMCSFPDIRLALLYSDLALAFSRRRSLLLISNESTHQHQIRIDELPWAVPLLAEISKHRDDVKDRDFARQLLRFYWLQFPVTLMPNKVVSALRDLLFGASSAKTKTRERDDESQAVELPPLPPLLEELAADIFGRTFSSKFTKVARTVAPILKHTTYSRYYLLDPVFEKIESKEISLMEAADLLRRTYYISQSPKGVFLSISGNGMLLEAVQLLTTHNLILADFLFDDDNGAHHRLRLPEIVEQAWKGLVKITLVTPPKVGTPTWFHVSATHARQVSHAFRQFLYFLSKLSPIRVQQEFLAENVSTLQSKYCGSNPETSKLVDAFCEKIAVIQKAVVGEHVDPTEVCLGWRHLS